MSLEKSFLNSKDKKDLAICIPTYNRPAHVREYLEKSLYTLAELGIDIFYYDSSDNRETEAIIKEYSKNYNNLFYEKADPSLPSNVKIYRIWSDGKIADNYRYVWMMGDAVRWSKSVYFRVLRELGNDYHMIIPDPYDFSGVGTKVICDRQEVFEKSTVSLTLFGCTILNTDLFIKGTDWDTLEKKYCNSKHMGFSHIGFYFERMAQIVNLRVLNLCCIIDNRTLMSGIKKDNHWGNVNFYNTFLVQWPNTIRDIPDCYKDKNAMIKKYNRCVALVSEESMNRMRGEHSYGISEFLRFYGRWRMCTDISMGSLFKAAICPARTRVTIYDPEKTAFEEKEKTVNEEMLEFAKGFQKIYIYGAGKIGKEKAAVFAEKSKEVAGFLVSGKEHEDSVMNIPVLTYDPSIVSGGDTCIILALSFANMVQVVSDHFLNFDRNRLFAKCVYPENRIIDMTDHYDDIDPRKFAGEEN